MNKFTLVAAAAFTALAATAASAETFEKVGEAAGWDININKNMGPGCLLSREMENKDQVQMGINALSATRTGYIAVYTKDKLNISEGEKIAAELDVDGQKFQGTFSAQKAKGFYGAFVPVNNEAFIYDLAKKHVLTVSVAGEPKVIVSLDGTNAAFEALRACQEGL
jgi:hypothetical protein